MKKNRMILAIFVLMTPRLAHTFETEDIFRPLRAGMKLYENIFTDFGSKDDRITIAPEGNMLADAALFFALTSQKQAVLRASCMADLAANIPLATFQKMVRLHKKITGTDDLIKTSTGYATVAGTYLTYAAKEAIKGFKLAPALLQLMRQAPAVAAYNARCAHETDTQLHAFRAARFSREKKWQLALLTLRYIAAFAERTGRNEENTESRVYGNLARNSIEALQQHRLAQYIKTTIQYAVSPEAEEQDLQAALGTAGRLKRQAEQALKKAANTLRASK